MFDPTKEDWAPERQQLRRLLDDEQWEAARRTTINAHYTDPDLARQMWQVMADLGLTSGSILEPGCGAGTFVGTASAGMSMVGVELDPITAGIARHLYPQAEIRNESFADTSYPSGSFDAAIGNVPFSQAKLHDPRHNAARHSMHNHFLIKALHLTRPGGMVVALTSMYTMDSVDSAARHDLGQLADLVGAIRLPTGAHRRSAGTSAVTDLLILRRREDGREPHSDVWQQVTRAPLEDGTLHRMNPYWQDKPQRVLGRLTLEHGQHEATLNVVPNENDLERLPDLVAEQLKEIVGDAHEHGLVATPTTEAIRLERRQAISRVTELWDGSIVATNDGFQVAEGGLLADLAVPRTQRAEVRALLDLRDRARDLVTAEATSNPDAELSDQRTGLREAWEAYVARYGPINRYTLRPTGRMLPQLDPDTGQAMLDPITRKPIPGEEPAMARIVPPAIRTIRHDPHGPLVLALEHFDDATSTAEPAGLLLQRTLHARPQVTHAETPADALAVSLDQTGRVDLALIADALNVPEDQARAALGTLVFHDPAEQRLVPAEEYLSGNVVAKLDQARDAAADDPEAYAGNVAALIAAQPEPLGPGEIDGRLGAVWLSPSVHQQFLREILRDESLQVSCPLPTEWKVTGVRTGVLATSEWGTGRRPAVDLAEAAMRQKTIQVHDTVPGPEGKKVQVLNPIETQAAQEKAEALQTRFSEWLWEDPDRATHLVDVYNRTFNALRARDYTQAGDHLTLPGLSSVYTLRPHQRAAVARMISEPTVLLAHEVGAGKTLEMVAGVTELKRLGMVRKPLIIVPNHMLEQFAREWLQAYPAARVLAAGSSDLTGTARRQFVARLAVNDWDGVLLTHSAFRSIGVSASYASSYIQDQVHETRALMEQAREAGESDATIKHIETRVLQQEEAWERSLDIPRDPGLGFEATGVDYLVVDEAHLFKNLKTDSNITGAAIVGSERAADLHLKLEYLRSQGRDRVGTFATATPIANSVTEAHVMMRYLRPDLLQAARVHDFDAWAATFGRTVTELELKPAGGGYALKTRLSQFQNVPEMMSIWGVFADVKTGADLKLPVPLIAQRPDGARTHETVVVPPTPEQDEYMAELVERASNVERRLVSPEEDNMLKISSNGRAAALDIRLLEPDTTPTALGKLDVAAARIISIWEANQANTYLGEGGAPSPIPGALQLVFSDLGTPNPERWNAYTELRTLLIQGGIPADQVRFVHDASTNAQKASLFAACRAGHVAVLLGSTEKMGVGTNVQDRVVALHHLDCPWRPADLAQRDGRAIRQGNQNPEVQLLQYVTEGSFDAFSWQTVARKATFIDQVLHARVGARVMEDIGGNVLTATEAKALASGDPLILEQASADAAYQKLRRQEIAHDRGQTHLRTVVAQARTTITTTTEAIHQLEAAAARTTDVSGEQFRMVIGERGYTKRAEAADALAPAIMRAYRGLELGGEAPIATLGGQTVIVTSHPISDTDTPVGLGLQDVPGSITYQGTADVGAPSVGLVRVLENKTTNIPATLARFEQKLAQATADLADGEARIGKPFPLSGDLAAASERLAAVNATIAERAKSAEERAKSAGEPSDEEGRARDISQQPAPTAEPNTAERLRALAEAIPHGALRRSEHERRQQDNSQHCSPQPSVVQPEGPHRSL